VSTASSVGAVSQLRHIVRDRSTKMVSLSTLLLALGVLAIAMAQDSLFGTLYAPVYSDYNCPEPDGFFADASQCDKYFHCTEGLALEKTCQDGLVFKPDRPFPCVYPQEADCRTRGGLQEAQPTEECPRQFALFRSSQDPAECGGFTNCVNGKAFRVDCPESLAYSESNLICQFADEVEGCDVAGYLGFQCPQLEFSPDQVGLHTLEAHPADCSKYFVCLNKEDGSVQPRLQSCSEATVFDPATKSCSEYPEQVPGCENAIPVEVLEAYRQRAQAASDRREARLVELRSTFAV